MYIWEGDAGGGKEDGLLSVCANTTDNGKQQEGDPSRNAHVYSVQHASG